MPLFHNDESMGYSDDRDKQITEKENMISAMRQSCADYQNKIRHLENQNIVLEAEVKKCHAHIINLQDFFNDCRNWFSNVEFSPATEELDEEISLSDCDEHQAVYLKNETENYATSVFRYWFSHINKYQKITSLGCYNKFKDDNLIEFSKDFKNE